MVVIEVRDNADKNDNKNDQRKALVRNDVEWCRHKLHAKFTVKFISQIGMCRVKYGHEWVTSYWTDSIEIDSWIANNFSKLKFKRNIDTHGGS